MGLAKELQECRTFAEKAEALLHELQNSASMKVRISPMGAVLTEERPIQATACVHCSREVLVDEVTLSIDADGTEVISTEELMERLKWLQEEKKTKDADPDNWLKKGSARQLWTEAGQGRSQARQSRKKKPKGCEEKFDSVLGQMGNIATTWEAMIQKANDDSDEDE